MTNVTLVKVTDAEGDGDCQACGRTGLRWLAILSDGTHVGTECAKAALGFKPAPASYSWVPAFEAVAEHVAYGETWILWQAKGGSATRITRAGNLTHVGGARAVWEREGWAA